MIKWLTSAAAGLFSSAGVALALLPGGVVIDHNLPAELPKSGVAVFDITIQKGTLDYFGRLQFDVPEGVELQPLNTQGGSFSSDSQSQTATISWLSLPDEDPFTVRLELDASQANSEMLSMPWQFAFVENNARQLVELEAIKFRNILSKEQQPSPHQSPASETINTPTEVKTDVVDRQASELPPSCVRTVTELASGEGFHVSLDVKNLPEGQFSKLTEALPLGCEALPGKSASSICTQSGQALQFLWFDSPGKDQLLEYQLPRCALSGIDELSGILSYVQEDLSHEIAVLNVGKTELNQDFAHADAGTSPELGVSYRIQIAAGHSEVVTDYFARMFDFAPCVTVEQHDGWLKYTSGGFDRYENARNERDHITAIHDFRGPFVAAYQDGERITVQHALTLSGCGWTP